MKRVIQVALLFLVFMTFLVGVLAWGTPGNNQERGPSSRRRIGRLSRITTNASLAL